MSGPGKRPGGDDRSSAARGRPDRPGERAQVFTLEGVLAAVIVIVALVFALQTVVVTPATSGDSSAAAESQEVDSALKSAAANGQLKRATLFWDRDTADITRFHGASEFRYYTRERFQSGDYPAFLIALDDRFGSTTSMTITVHYRDGSGDMTSQLLVDGGAPGAGAVRASTTVTLFDSDQIVDDGGKPTGTTLEDLQTNSSARFYAPDVSGSDVYNVLEVEVIVW